MKLLFSFLIIIAFTGCGADKYTLFQEKSSTTKGFFIPSDMKDIKQKSQINIKKSKKFTYEYKIAPSDRLSVMVYKHPELSTRSANVQANAEIGLLVSSSGTINVALIGDINVKGLTAKETSVLLQKKLSTYVKNPYVNVEIINKRIYVLGEVKKPGMVPVDSDYMSIIEVLSASGGLTTYAKRDDIKILRGDLNDPDITTINLTNMSALKVADLMIQPNDIIYISPSDARATNIAIGEMTPAIGLVNSILSTFVNMKYLSDK